MPSRQRIENAWMAMEEAGRAVMWALAATHVFILVTLFAILLSIAPARADEACGGSNLLTAMRAAEPEHLAELERQAAAVPNGKGLLWRIERPGTPPSFLLGTMHIADPRVLAMPPGAEAGLASARTVAVEAVEILDDKKAAAAMLMKPELMMFTDGTTIADHLSPEDYRRLDEGLKTRGLSLDSLSRMKPWIIAAVVSLPACELDRKARGASFLDKQIAERAAASGRPVKGLETAEEQLGAIAELPMAFHFKALIETLALGDRMADITETMIQLYLSGDIGMTMPMLSAVAGSQTDDQSYAAFQKRVVDDRNWVMAERAAPLLQEGSAFIAVGALHLPGAGGLVELFRRQGYTVTTVN